MPKNALTILRELVFVELKDYYPDFLVPGRDSMFGIRNPHAQKIYSINVGIAEILFEYFSDGEVSIEIILHLEHDRLCNVYDGTIPKRPYKEMKEILYRIRDVIFECYHYSNDTAVLIPAIREIVDNS